MHFGRTALSEGTVRIKISSESQVSKTRVGMGKSMGTLKKKFPGALRCAVRIIISICTYADKCIFPPISLRTVWISPDSSRGSPPEIYRLEPLGRTFEENRECA